VTGLEEGVFPHQRSIDDDSAIEEERRLCYVAVTRAMKKLHLSNVRRRRLSGQVLGGLPSRFLKDLPQDCFESIVQPRPTYYDVDTEGAGPWGGRWNRGGYDASERVSGRGRAQPAWSRGTTPEGNRPAAPVPGGQGRGGNITVHYDNDQPGSELGLRVGARLRHPKFGAGEVRAWQGEGADLKVTLRFPGGEVKTILARFLTKP
jgi:DNA helicase-2/ATP-dependent DNA helicase PcrA